jgi:NAD(P)-dependent dehydrogenase (short-subunit alcohol dehydrogenase family)
MNTDLTGRVALVTGAARGIGAGIARVLADNGCSVYVSDLDAAGARACANSLPGQCTGIALDVTDESAVKRAVGEIARGRGGLDILVNNAGVVTLGPFDKTSRAEWDRLVSINLSGIFNCVQASVPVMVGRRGAAIVNIASVSAEKGGGSFGNVWYGATKAAVVAITKGLSRDLGPRGIRVNAISPGVVETDMTKDLLTPETHARVLARFPIGRFAKAEDIALAALYLVSDAAGFVTGETLVVDGGFLRT